MVKKIKCGHIQKKPQKPVLLSVLQYCKIIVTFILWQNCIVGSLSKVSG